MAAIDIHDAIRTETALRIGNPLTGLVLALRRAIKRGHERRQIVRLSRLPARIVRDMGFDPEKVAAELEGSWDDITLSQLRR